MTDIEEFKTFLQSFLQNLLQSYSLENIEPFLNEFKLMTGNVALLMLNNGEDQKEMVDSIYQQISDIQKSSKKLKMLTKRLVKTTILSLLNKLQTSSGKLKNEMQILPY